MQRLIKFSHNWNNKLQCNVFTTIRRYTEEKEQYYKQLIGERFNCLLNGNCIGEVLLVSIDKVRYCDISDSIKMVDVGVCNSDEINKIFDKFGIKNDDLVIILTFKKL